MNFRSYRPALRFSYNGTGNWSVKLQIGAVGDAQMDVPYYTSVNNNTAFVQKCPTATNDLVQESTMTLQPGNKNV